MAKKKVTLDDISKDTGLSKTTISYYLNKKYDSISENSILKIEKSINDLGYVFNQNYRRKKITNQIGLVVVDITDPFCANICKGVTDVCAKRGYNVMMVNADNNPVVEKKGIKSLVDKTDGIIINTSGLDLEGLEILDNTPVVLIDKPIENAKYDLITSNNYEAVSELMMHLLDKGYEAFCFVTEDLNTFGAARQIRHKAFQDFSVEHNYFYFDTKVIDIYDDKTLMLGMMDFLIKTENKKRVFIGANGKTLLKITLGINTLKLKVPQDVGICGYDDFEWSSLVYDGITTIKQKTYSIGYEAGERLLNRISDKNMPTRHIELRSRLISRNSL